MAEMHEQQTAQMIEALHAVLAQVAEPTAVLELAARLTTETLAGPASPEDIERLLATREATRRETSEGTEDLDVGLASLVETSQRRWLVEALRRYPGLTRAELAARLRISESTLYRKLRQHGIGG